MTLFATLCRRSTCRSNGDEAFRTRTGGPQSQPHMSIFQAATTFIFLGAVSVPSATCNDARFLPESHILKQYTPSDCWGHEVDCTKTATPAAHVDCSYATNTSFHLVGVKSASEVFFSQADFGYLGEFVSSLQNYCRPETQFDSSLTCTANLQFCSGVKLSTFQSQLDISFYYTKEVHTSPLPFI